MSKPKKYIEQSMLFRYWNMVEDVVKGNINPDYYKMKKITNKYKEKEAVIRDKIDELKVKDAFEVSGEKKALNEELKALNNLKNEELKKFGDYNPLYDSMRVGFTKCKKDVAKISKKDRLNEEDIMSLNGYMLIHRYAVPKNTIINGKTETGDAVRELIDNIFKKEIKKMEFSRSCVNKGVKMDMVAAFENEKLGSVPTMHDYMGVRSDIEDFNERIKKADDNMHINSSEYKAMIKAYKDLAELIAESDKKKTIMSTEIGDKLEALQMASVNYISKKGVGGQHTELGRERLELALDIANTAFKYSEMFPSFETAKRAYAATAYSDFVGYSDTKNVLNNVTHQFVVNKDDIGVEKVKMSEEVVNELNAAYNTTKDAIVVEKKADAVEHDTSFEDMDDDLDINDDMENDEFTY